MKTLQERIELLGRAALVISAQVKLFQDLNEVYLEKDLHEFSLKLDQRIVDLAAEKQK